ncbi:unnamed protein product [Dibothriocephalus latus]|uniref:Par3/HAL N-terminal domain-containing protein n=1 Tax=Dibothriocephalus latus TaxID=60516 RepID=A0A3P6Q9J0_DIBLA|nr:unnamed protein product [Dibothriocephalus latus]
MTVTTTGGSTVDFDDVCKDDELRVNLFYVTVDLRCIYRTPASLALLNAASDLDRLLVHHLSLARDGGILDWDDHVSEVLDDREQVYIQDYLQFLSRLSYSFF